MKVKEEIGAFDRDGLEIATHEEALVRRFAIRSPGQDQEMAFEITRSDYATEFASLLQHGSLNRARALADGGRDFWWVLKILLYVMIVSTSLLAVVTMIFLWS